MFFHPVTRSIPLSRDFLGHISAPGGPFATTLGQGFPASLTECLKPTRIVVTRAATKKKYRDLISKNFLEISKEFSEISKKFC